MSFNIPKSQKSERRRRLENVLKFINNNDLDGKIYDMSHLYNDFYYDGYEYRSYTDKSFRMKGSFESGYIFEIGRFIHKNNISFLDVLEFRSKNKED